MLLPCYIQKHSREKKNKSKPGDGTLRKYCLPEEIKVCHPFYSISLIKKYIHFNLILIDVDCFTSFLHGNIG